MKQPSISRSLRVFLVLFGLFCGFAGFDIWRTVSMMGSVWSFFGGFLALFMITTGLGLIFYPQRTLEIGS